MKEILRNKKAVSHLEIIISFIIFATFVFFILYYLNPVKHQNINTVLFSTLKENIKSRVEVNLFETLLVLRAPSAISSCFVVPSPYSSNQNLAVYNQLSDENKIQTLYNSYSPGNGIVIPASTSGIYYVYSSNQNLKNLDDDGSLVISQCTTPIPLDISNYSFSSTKSYNLYSLKNLTKLNDSYYSGYNDLKKELHFPLGNDFNVYINKLGENFHLISLENKMPEKIEVYAIEIPIEIMDDNGQIFQGILNIQVW